MFSKFVFGICILTIVGLSRGSQTLAPATCLLTMCYHFEDRNVLENQCDSVLAFGCTEYNGSISGCLNDSKNQGKPNYFQHICCPKDVSPLSKLTNGKKIHKKSEIASMVKKIKAAEKEENKGGKKMGQSSAKKVTGTKKAKPRNGTGEPSGTGKPTGRRGGK